MGGGESGAKTRELRRERVRDGAEGSRKDPPSRIQNS